MHRAEIRSIGLFTRSGRAEHRPKRRGPSTGKLVLPPADAHHR